MRENYWPQPAAKVVSWGEKVQYTRGVKGWMIVIVVCGALVVSVRAALRCVPLVCVTKSLNFLWGDSTFCGGTCCSGFEKEVGSRHSETKGALHFAGVVYQISRTY